MVLECKVHRWAEPVFRRLPLFLPLFRGRDQATSSSKLDLIMNYVQFTFSMLGICLAIGLQQTCHAQKSPNVVLILSDDQAWTDYSFMGHPVIQTPHLDRLAARSATFRRGYTPTPLCRPSLMTMITGLYPHQHGVTGNDPKPDKSLSNAEYDSLREQLITCVDQHPTIPKLLGEHGYLSMQSGKWWEGNYVCHGQRLDSGHAGYESRQRMESWFCTAFKTDTI